MALTSEPARDRLRQVLPAVASVDGPVDTTAAVSPRAFAEALRITATEEGVAALIAVLVQSASAGLLPVLSAARLPVPVTAVVLDQPEAVRLLPADGAAPSVPAYAYPEAAARALARAARYGTWRSRPPGTVPEFADVRAGQARSIVSCSWPGCRAAAGCRGEADAACCAATACPVEFRRAAAPPRRGGGGLGGHVVLRPTCPACCTRPWQAPSSWTCTAPMRYAPRWAACKRV